MAIILQSLFLTIPAILRALPMLAAALALWIGNYRAEAEDFGWNAARFG